MTKIDPTKQYVQRKERLKMDKDCVAWDEDIQGAKILKYVAKYEAGYVAYDLNKFIMGLPKYQRFDNCMTVSNFVAQHPEHPISVEFKNRAK